MLTISWCLMMSSRLTEDFAFSILSFRSKFSCRIFLFSFFLLTKFRLLGPYWTNQGILSFSNVFVILWYNLKFSFVISSALKRIKIITNVNYFLWWSFKRCRSSFSLKLSIWSPWWVLMAVLQLVIFDTWLT